MIEDVVAALAVELQCEALERRELRRLSGVRYDDKLARGVGTLDVVSDCSFA